MVLQHVNDDIKEVYGFSNYKNLKTQDIATGKDYVADVLDVVGDVASIGASAAMIASAIYMIKR